ncbi:MAG TPA: carbohydrate ABC transporter permease [Chloroflexia bacterium]|nr:carbohydrate ABC transporter permease [Chloroflexia bacterium]
MLRSSTSNAPFKARFRSGSYKKLSGWKLVREIIFYSLLSLFGVIMILPFIWSLETSLKPNKDIFATPVQWLPTSLTFDHYIEAFTTVPFAHYFWNSLFLAVAGVISNLFLGSLAGYAFARMRFRGNGLLFRLLLVSMMVPSIVTMIPTFIILRSFPLAGGNDITGQGGHGLLNNYLAVILPGAAGAFAVFLMRQFFLTLPVELGEAARIDGCSEFRIFWRIYLPQCKPALATLAVFTFQAGWNSFLWPLIVFSNQDMKTVQMGLQAFSYNHSTDYGPLMAGSVVATLPTLFLFIYAQKYFSQGISFTGNN